MTDFRSLLNRLSQGSIDADELIKQLSRIAEETPEQIPALIEAIDEGFRAGHLPPQIHAIMLARIKRPAPADAETPAPPSGVAENSPQDEKTHIIDRDDDATLVIPRPGKEPVIDDEATRVVTRPTPPPCRRRGHQDCHRAYNPAHLTFPDLQHSLLGQYQRHGNHHRITPDQPRTRGG
ncbi:MAG: hypothetical protein JMN27_03640 [gamma proteobacterium endosymbiont of Lamellibrachia anaximandri]|nr:hypothetical protein [gamma proteobacterium endosymbiont of Lamellibrachia anaximandri]MBL3532905.1 hypothetical protein [gamma proteobacterium endosymbiont of Lamellibrachia anaximandri]